MQIKIETIPHKEQRYPTCGDYFVGKGGSIQVKVSEELGDDSAFLVAIHELVELYLLRKRGVTMQEVDDFDIAYEKAHREGGTLEGERIDDSEPGDDPKAPYFKEHQFATALESLVAVELNVPWKEHADRVEALP